MMRFEGPWAEAVLGAFAGCGDSLVSSPTDGVDYAASYARMLRRATGRAALGLRLALWLAALSPLWLLGKCATLAGLPQEERGELLARLVAHPSFAVRELMLLLKLCAAMALFAAPAVRQQSGYDEAQAAQSDVRLRLPRVDERLALRVWPANDDRPGEVELPPREAP
ncbi:MAG: hypothetical protein OEZ06_18945 [Myxococcales bacterium]|nr:hypothetical protein [Myxococcales bacterium]